MAKRQQLIQAPQGSLGATLLKYGLIALVAYLVIKNPSGSAHFLHHLGVELSKFGSELGKTKTKS